MEKFKFFLGADILEKSEEGEGGKRIIRGYASTPTLDRQDESTIQKGLDISEFVNNGWLNFDHDNSVILGYPTAGTHIDENGLWVEGELLKGVPLADRMWELAVALKKSNAPRKLGFSIEGKVLERAGNVIKRAKIYNCAITANPVNTEATWDAVVKSFNNDTDIDVMKGLEAGHSTSPETQTDGGAFRKESIYSGIKKIAENLEDPACWLEVKNNMANGGNVSKNELVVYLQLSKGLSKKQALEIIQDYE